MQLYVGLGFSAVFAAVPIDHCELIKLADNEAYLKLLHSWKGRLIQIFDSLENHRYLKWEIREVDED